MNEAIRIHQPDAEAPSYPPATTRRYQPLGWMSEDQFLALKASIRAVGRVQVPIVKDEAGETLDGHHRELAVAELRSEGAKIPHLTVETVVGLSEDDKRHHALRANLVRRQISRKERRAIIAAELKRTPELPDAWLAELCGTTGKTVRSVREELESQSEIPTLTEFRRRDGKKYPRSILTTTQTQTEDVQDKLRQLGDDLPRGPLTVKSLNRAERKKDRQERASAAPPQLTLDDIQLLHTDFRDLKIEDKSVDMILTDPPYDKGSEDLWWALDEFAYRVLKDDGLLVTYCPQINLFPFLCAFENFKLFRLLAVMFDKDKASPNFSCNVLGRWRPVAIFSRKKDFRPKRRIFDLIDFDERDKSYHHWQQGVRTLEYLIDVMSEPGDLILDPFGGGFTTAVAAYRWGRKAISCDVDEAAVALGRQRLVLESEVQPWVAPFTFSNVNAEDMAGMAS